jgi:hypothetical protein
LRKSTLRSRALRAHSLRVKYFFSGKATEKINHISSRLPVRILRSRMETADFSGKLNLTVALLRKMW